jgi:hypothetical protein
MPEVSGNSRWSHPDLLTTTSYSTLTPTSYSIILRWNQNRT